MSDQDPPSSHPQTPPTVPYDTRADHVTRRQFRLLLVLTGINTVLLGCVVAGPMLVPFLNEQWAAYQQRREARLAEQQRLAAEERLQRQIRQQLAQLQTAPLPEGTIVYTEHPAEAQALLSSDERYEAVSQRMRPDLALQPHASMLGPAQWRQIIAISPAMRRDNEGTVYLQRRREPSGTERIVWVTIAARQEGLTLFRPHQGTPYIPVTTTRTLTAGAIGTAQGAPYQPFKLRFDDSDADAARVRTDGVYMTDGRRIRIFGGRPDPDDESRFTIDYTVDGQPGRFAGWLEDGGRTRLEPEDGRIVSRTETQIVWDPAPEATVATHSAED